MNKEERNKRFKSIDELGTSLERKIRGKQKSLLERILEWMLGSLSTVDGRLDSSIGNIRAVSSVNSIIREFAADEMRDIEDAVYKDIQKVTALNKKYFTNFVDRNKIDSVHLRVYRKQSALLGIVGDSVAADGLLRSITSSKQPYIRIRAALLSAAAQGISMREARKSVREVITGTDKKYGILESHLNRLSKDTYAKFDRGLSQDVAIEAGLEFFVYEGGLVRDSRQFCKGKAGKVFHISEAKEWKNQNFQGKNAGYDPLTDLGGYNCQHGTNFISKQLAKRLGKDVENYD